MNKTDNFWELISARFHHELNQSEEEYINQILEESTNKEIFRKTENIYSGFEFAKKLKKADKSSSWKQIQRQIQKNRIRKMIISASKYAAMLVAAIVITSLYHTLKQEFQNPQYTKIEVQDGQTSHLFLFDGTEVWLNSGTTFMYPNQFNLKERVVHIDGEAFFKVAPNKKIPFKVKTSELEVKVLGTSFNVSAYHSESQQSIVLVEGEVQINNLQGKKIANLHPGQIGMKCKNSSLKIEDTDTYFYTSWKDGKVVFNAERLGDIAEKLERWYNVEIRFEEESLRNLKFSGTILRNKPINQSIMALELLAPIQFKYQVRDNEKDLITIIKK